MSIHDIFAANLRGLCEKFGSISEVSRQAGINRQQFNRYLSGQNIPNRRTISRLAKFLGVEEATLFSSRQGKAKEQSEASGDLIADGIHMPAPRELAFEGGRQTMLQPGFYCCYFPLQGSNQFLVKSAMKIVAKGNCRYFSRRTLFRSASSQKATLAQGRHRGVVLANSSDVYLVGVNTLTPHHLSMIVLERQQIAGSNVLQGLSITRGTTTHFASRVCIERMGTGLSAMKRHIRSLGIVPVTAPDLNPTIALLMTTQQEPRSAQIGLPYFEELMLTQHQDWPEMGKGDAKKPERQKAIV
ncbi:MAG: helix-turn-helix transcriptional regulator [Rhizobiales bacterium]|nr:helix-turn-helix transcriptional regulator [Hyphomicrobiales bacterium]